MSQSDVEIKMADVNMKLFRIIDLIQVTAPIGVQEKGSMISVRY